MMHSENKSNLLNRLFGAMEIHGHIKTEIMLDLKSALEYAVSIRNSK